MKIRSLIIALAVLPGAVVAAGSDSSPSAAKDPVLEQANAAIGRSDWAAAQAALRDGVAKDAGNAEYHNLYAYSLRKGPNPNMDLVFKHYNEALRINPKHRGAHEYLGEAYLMVGNLGKAKEELAQLDKLCLFGCKEYSELKKSIADFEAKQAKR